VQISQARVKTWVPNKHGVTFDPSTSQAQNKRINKHGVTFEPSTSTAQNKRINKHGVTFVISPIMLGWDIMFFCAIIVLYALNWLTKFYKHFACILLIDISSNILHAIQIHQK